MNDINLIRINYMINTLTMELNLPNIEIEKKTFQKNIEQFMFFYDIGENKFLINDELFKKYPTINVNAMQLLLMNIRKYYQSYKIKHDFDENDAFLKGMKKEYDDLLGNTSMEVKMAPKPFLEADTYAFLNIILGLLFHANVVAPDYVDENVYQQRLDYLKEEFKDIDFSFLK